MNLLCLKQSITRLSKYLDSEVFLLPPYLCNLVLHGADQTFPCFPVLSWTTTQIWREPTGPPELAHHLRETSAERTESSSSMRSFFPPALTIQPTQALCLRAPCLFTIMILSCVHKHTSPKCFSSRAGNFFHLPSLLSLPLPIAARGNLCPSSASLRQMQKVTAAPLHKTAVNYSAAKEKHTTVVCHFKPGNIYCSTGSNFFWQKSPFLVLL